MGRARGSIRSLAQVSLRSCADNSVATGRGTILRWAGSKRKLLPVLAQFWSPTFKRYIEPFAGSASLFFELRPKRAILGDKNEELIELYEVLREQPEKLGHRLAHIPRTREAYYRWRSYKPSTLDRETRALRFLFLNRHCFNGIYRTNDRGQFNVPFGSRLGATLGISTIVACAKCLRDVQFVRGDFSHTAAMSRPGDFVYLDPPFVTATRRNRRQYGCASFLSKDLTRLDDCLYDMNTRGVHFVVSYGDSAEARKLASSWYCRKVRVRRNIAGFSGFRRNAFEWIVTNIESELAR